jgi:hypothetical protein
MRLRYALVAQILLPRFAVQIRQSFRAEAGIQPQVAVGMDTGFRRYDRKRIFDRGSAVLGLPALNYFSA